MIEGEKFVLDISKWADKANGRLDLVVRRLTFDIFSRVIQKSPVDTGRFKGNWQPTVEQIPTGIVEAFDKSGEAATAKVSALVAAMPIGTTVYLTNNLPYARKLEYGHSKQAPAGMVRTTVQHFIARSRKIVSEVSR